MGGGEADGDGDGRSSMRPWDRRGGARTSTTAHMAREKIIVPRTMSGIKSARALGDSGPNVGVAGLTTNTTNTSGKRVVVGGCVSGWVGWVGIPWVGGYAMGEWVYHG